MERNKRTILLLISGLGNGGAERIFHSLATELSKNYRVVECVFNLDNQVYPFATKENFVLTPKIARNPFEKLLYLILRIYRLWMLKKKIKPDYCISQLESSDYFNVLTRQKDEKAICLVQCSMIFNQDINGISGWLRKKFLMPIMYRRADAIVSVSGAIKIEFQEYFSVPACRIHVIYNFIDQEDVKIKSQEPLDPLISSIFTESYCFVTAGRLTAQKNHLSLIAVFSSLIKQFSAPPKLFILGDGELRNSLIEFSLKEGLRVYSIWDTEQPSNNHDIFFMGFTANPFKYFANAKWFIFSSLWEGLPLVLVESMAAGLPVISADCPTGPADILETRPASLSFVTQPLNAKYGILMPMIPSVSSKDIIIMWSRHIVSIYKDTKIREGYVKAQPERLLQFSLDYAISQWIKILNNL